MSRGGMFKLKQIIDANPPNKRAIRTIDSK